MQKNFILKNPLFRKQLLQTRKQTINIYLQSVLISARISRLSVSFCVLDRAIRRSVPDGVLFCFFKVADKPICKPQQVLV